MSYGPAGPSWSGRIAFTSLQTSAATHALACASLYAFSLVKFLIPVEFSGGLVKLVVAFARFLYGLGIVPVDNLLIVLGGESVAVGLQLFSCFVHTTSIQCRMGFVK